MTHHASSQRTDRIWRVPLSVMLLLLSFWTPSAFAYRPFDSTDASVADKGEFELELGPMGYRREAPMSWLIVPAVAANFGISGDREIVLEGKVYTAVEGGSGGHRNSLEDTALSLKQIHRRGALQGEPGPSIASECGALLPSVNGDSGVGAYCAGIVSQRWSALTLHLNAALSRSRQHDWGWSSGLVIEGPHAWRARPVLEITAEQSDDRVQHHAILVGMIWQSRERLSLDCGVRAAHSDGRDIFEIRAGLTWSRTYRNPRPP